MLFETDRHEPLCESKWSATQAHAAVRRIVEDLENALGSNIVWPSHPLDQVAIEPLTGYKTLYLGAAGALWAMSYLEREGAVSLRVKPADLISRIYESYLADPDTRSVVPSYFLGEVGVLLVLWRMTGSSEAADRLWASIRENVFNPTNEALWGAPGTMVGALHMYKWTNEGRWRDLFLENAERLWETWLPAKTVPCHLWTQDLYGNVVQLLGAGHGFAGNVYPLLRGSNLLSAEWLATLYKRCLETLSATAIFEGDEVNWPQSIGTPRPGRTHMLVQWCHGSPGIVTSLADFPCNMQPDMDELLVRAGITTWNAGPLRKGYGLCHGTAGNGYAFLKLHRRTGDPIWLERARAFAMHAIVQQERAREEYGRGRYTLWTGDPGLAIYLWHCLVGSGDTPGLDLLD
jgi:lantibiotic modifying enzyme